MRVNSGSSCRRKARQKFFDLPGADHSFQPRITAGME
jgi:hypothetical protein